jgi:ligand-binding SRPBCC domain-containing protein
MGREYSFSTSMFVDLPRDRVFPFFADAANLERITPPELRFRITSPLPPAIERGVTLHYRLHLFGIPMRWSSLIPVWEPPERFVDEQLRGPYRSWIHTHQFAESGSGTIISDEVRYSLPFGMLGALAHPFIALQLRRIFAFRQRATLSLLSPGTGSSRH